MATKENKKPKGKVENVKEVEKTQKIQKEVKQTKTRAQLLKELRENHEKRFVIVSKKDWSVVEQTDNHSDLRKYRDRKDIEIFAF